MGSRSFCIICGSFSKLKLITHVINTEKHISYLDLLYKCFFIQFLDKHYDNENLICKTCIEDLKYCCMFRSKVEKAHKKLYHILETKETLQNELLVIQKSLKKSKSTEIKSKNEDEHKLHISKCMSPVEEKNQIEDYYDSSSINVKGLSDCDMSQGNVSDGEWSTNTDDILTATGYWNEMKKITKRKPYQPPMLENNCTECPLCEEKICDKVKLQEHYNRHNTYFMLCHICGKTYCHKFSLGVHMSRHYGEKFPCSECKKEFLSKASLVYHIKHEHLRAKMYKCVECRVSFYHRSERDKHFSHVHRHSEGYSCDRCDGVFNNQSNLNTHIRRTHLKQKNYSCEFCCARFFSRVSLKKHITKHTGVKDLICQICGKAFGHRQYFKQHLKIHLDVKRFKCDLCDKAFVQKCSLVSHVKVHQKL